MLQRWRARRLACGVALLSGWLVAVPAQDKAVPRVDVSLVPAPRIEFPGPTDSNSPAYWLLKDGEHRLHLINSSRRPWLSVGPAIEDLGPARPARWDNRIDGGRWIEAVVPDVDGALYGYYHNEPVSACPEGAKTVPRIGAARSRDGGRTWHDLGIILEAAPDSSVCSTPNRYFAGGVGDFSVMLDQSERDLHFFFSSYHRDLLHQGVAVARMLWADRDAPAGRVAIWNDGVWDDPVVDQDGHLHYPAPAPMYRAAGSWHSRRPGRVDAFWGPSVHWNTHLQAYVMLLNRAADAHWMQEGIYVAVGPTLDDPDAWSVPRRILDGGSWYPQVVGLALEEGTDRLAGQAARFFMGGVSEHVMVFEGRHPGPRQER
jgi:hypothetical protein